MKKKLLTGMLAGVMAAACCAPLAGGVFANAEGAATEDKVIDMYLIAGQSNAAGFSSAGSLTETFENVAYAGQTEKALRGTEKVSCNSDFLSDYSKYQWSVAPGYGATTRFIGPEYGMAKVLNERYTGDKKAMIFKTAAGGTSLLDSTSQLSASYGNWYPRSLWEEGYTPEIETASVNNDATGILYQLFVENFRNVYNTLVEEGYTPVVKGMAWMQGCTDLYSVGDNYGDTLTAFIKDIRADLAEITGDTTLEAMPFAIGEIAESFQGFYNTTQGQAYIDEMHRQQRRAAETAGAASTFSTDDLIIVDKSGDTKGTDVSHFSTADAVTLGERFANAILDIGGSVRVLTNAAHGSIGYTFDGNNIKFTVTPEGSRYLFSSLKINGQDVTADVVNGEYTLEDATGIVTAEATFTELEKYAITYEEVKNGAGFMYTYSQKYKGDTLSLKVVVRKGYKLNGVTFNGKAMTYNEESGEYEIVVTEAGCVKILAEAENAPKADDTTEEKESGCSGTIGAGAAALSMLVAGVAAALKKRRM